MSNTSLRQIIREINRRSLARRIQLFTEEDDAEMRGLNHLGGGTYEDATGTHWRKDENGQWQKLTPADEPIPGTTGAKPFGMPRPKEDPSPQQAMPKQLSTEMPRYNQPTPQQAMPPNPVIKQPTQEPTATQPKKKKGPLIVPPNLLEKYNTSDKGRKTGLRGLADFMSKNKNS
jgi:hypothetical protein